jgi:hypothetical protein
VKRFIAHNRAERILKAGSNDIVSLYRDMLKKLERIAVRYYKGQDSALTIGAMKRQVEEAFALRNRIITDNIQRAAANRYTDILHQCQRLVRRATGQRITGVLPDLADEAREAAGRILQNNDKLTQALSRQSAAELQRVGRLSLEAGRAVFEDSLREVINKNLRHSLNINYSSGKQVISTSAKVSLQSHHADDLYRAYGITEQRAIIPYMHDDPINAREHHVELHGTAPDENGLWWSSVTGAYTDEPGQHWSDDSENYGCMCYPGDLIWSDNVTLVSTQMGVITIPAGSYLLYIGA